MQIVVKPYIYTNSHEYEPARWKYLIGGAINATGGSNGVRDLGLMRSALNAPFQAFEGKEMLSVAFVQGGGNVPFGHFKSSVR